MVDLPDDGVQGRIEEYAERSESTTTNIRRRLEERFGGAFESIISAIDEYGLTTRWIAERTGVLPEEERREIHRFQYAHVYIFPIGGGDRSDYEHGRIEFKLSIYVVGEVDQDLRDRLREIEEPRLNTLFNTGPYQNYMQGPSGEGFNFVMEDENVEHERVGAHEVPETGLGIPRWEVEGYTAGGTLAGAAHGYANPYTSIEREVEPPEGEVWKVRSFNPSRGAYEISPDPSTPARERLKGSDKAVVLNGYTIGSMNSRGTVFLNREYKAPAQAQYTDRARIIEETGTPHQALSPGANVYKVDEDENRVILSTTEPVGFERIDPEDVAPDATGVRRELVLTEAEPTQFTVEQDENIAGLLGLYEPPTIRDIENGMQFNLHGSPIDPRTETNAPRGRSLRSGGNQE